MRYSLFTHHAAAVLRVLLVFCLPIFGNGGAVHAAPQVVVLRNGNVLQGDVTWQAVHIMVRSARTHIRLARADVEMVAPNLKAAYRRKSAQTAGYETTSRCQLIRWCVRHGLKQEAAAELETLQKNHPHHPQLDYLRQLANTHRSDWKQTALPLPAPLHPDRSHGAKVRDQLSKTTLAQFVRVVQPLLLNRCGQAGCHGTATDTSYQLMPSPWAKVPRGTTEQHLGATLRRIGTGPPRETVMWMSAASPHGPSSKKPLDPTELRIFQVWFELVSDELSDRPTWRDPDVHRGPNAAASGDVLEIDPFDPAAFNAAANTPTIAPPVQ